MFDAKLMMMTMLSLKLEQEGVASEDEIENAPFLPMSEDERELAAMYVDAFMSSNQRMTEKASRRSGAEVIAPGTTCVVEKDKVGTKYNNFLVNGEKLDRVRLVKAASEIQQVCEALMAAIDSLSEDARQLCALSDTHIVAKWSSDMFNGCFAAVNPAEEDVELAYRGTDDDDER